ncbi:rod shape-determining protein MreC [Mesobacillus selenatarsenatis]|uniref:Cell shape-determining protein MreC n=1 Tax=Mesobacillus selenatarsenatis TaxID=388741 RepID=A0A846TK96_9BACI|nr:rod shape-determining protein MreC [Mesobacillus selenatarsenatis]NKE06394.1 rod shape-determining protein MreC [Mesobacillus selenatarsenatis]
MPQFFFNKRLIMLLVSIIVLVALIGFSLREREELTWPEQFIKDSTSWVQSVVSRPTNYIAGLIENLQDLQNTYQENKELKKRVDDMARLEAKVYSLEKENEELQEILDKQESLADYEPIQAVRIARSPERWNELIIINRGASNGIEKNMAVITSKGLIGKIKSTTPFSATVQLISSIDPTNRISAILQAEEPLYGTIEGYDKKNELLLLKGLPFDAKIEKGQNVVTTGMGGIFPKDLPIGKVVKVVPDQFGLNQTAYIKPEANLYDLEHVMVVKKSMISVDIEESLEDSEGEEEGN